MSRDIITGANGPYNSNSATGYGRNAAINKRIKDNNILNGVINPKYQIQYSIENDKVELKSLIGYAGQSILDQNAIDNDIKENVGWDRFKELTNKAVSNAINITENNELIQILLRSVTVLQRNKTNIPDSELKNQAYSVEDHPECNVADTDGDGKVSTAEEAACTLMEDMLDEHADVDETGKLNLSVKDADGKVLEIGANLFARLSEQLPDMTKNMLMQIRQAYNLDEEVQKL